MSEKSCCTPGHGPRERVDDSPAPQPAPAPPGSPVHQVEQVRLPGGTFLMGTDDPEGFAADAEGPVREVRVSPFSMDATAVTNRQFEEFISQTGYRTDAEKFGWSYVFILQLSKSRRKRGNFEGRAAAAEWWTGIRGADWRHPAGPETSLEGKMDHPVVHVSWVDAAAFAEWAGKRLPTEAEWEFAARGGLEQRKYPWGDELTPAGKHLCNIWQGKFPEVNRPEDGHLWTAPVKSYAPNGYGLYEMTGNIWEWCADWWGLSWNTGRVPVNPIGPPAGTSRVIRGGSFLCHKSYCNRYRVAARTKNDPDSTTSHQGFRCVS